MLLIRDDYYYKRDCKDKPKTKKQTTKTAEIMKWNNVENNCKAMYEYHFINGTKPLERKMLIKVIADEFPELPRVRIAYAVDRCITSVAAPMSPTTFLTFVQSYLK